MKDYIRQLAGGQRSVLAGRNAAREYLQARILETLQEDGAFLHWAFLGGTALRFLYAIARFSEDLDFSLAAPQDAEEFKRHLLRVKTAFAAESYGVEVKLSRQKTIQSAWVRFPGLLYELGLSPRPAEVISVKVELDTRPPAGAVIETSLVRRHVTLNLSHYDKASLFSGKLHALLARPYLKGRDLYDLFWYLADRTWPEPNITLLQAALVQSGWQGGAVTGQTWRSLLAERLRAADWPAAIRDVAPFLERQGDLDWLTSDNCQRLLAGK